MRKSVKWRTYLSANERQRAEIARQVRQKKDDLKEELSDEEYLCGFLKTSKLYPVLTVILYSGNEPWDGPRSLHDMLDLAGLPEEIKNLVPDYRINVIELARLEDTTVFQTDLKHVIDFIKVSNDRNAVKKLVAEEPYFKRMTPEAYDVVAEYANISKNINVGVRKLGGEEMTRDLCKGLADWLDETYEEGIEKGIKEGIERGIIGFIKIAREYGESEEQIVSRLVKEYQMDETKAYKVCSEV